MMRKIKEKKRIIRHEQWIEIKVKDGVTVEERYPSNDEFEKERVEMDPPPDYIYRRLNFVNGVPSEYRGIPGPDQFYQYGGLFLQRMDAANWLEVYQREKTSGDTRVIPARQALPRPEELGPCPCYHCKLERELGLESRYTSQSKPGKRSL